MVPCGIDALSLHAGAVELRNAIERNFEVDLPATLMFDYPTTAAIAKFMTERMSLAITAALGGVRGEDQMLDEPPRHSTATEVVAVSSRHPGPSLTPGGFMHSILASADLQSPVPLSRWDNETVYTPDLVSARLTVTTRFATFCEGLEAFDTAVFRLSMTEAVTIDPQVRQVDAGRLWFALLGEFDLCHALYGTAKSGVGIVFMGVMRPELVAKSIVPVVRSNV